MHKGLSVLGFYPTEMFAQTQVSKSPTAGGVLVGGLSKFMLFGGAGVRTLGGR